MAKTKDEKFIICAYEQAQQRGDLHAPFDRYEIGRLVGINPKGVETICRLLVQANFLRSIDKNFYRFTDHGVKSVENLLDD